MFVNYSRMYTLNEGPLYLFWKQFHAKNSKNSVTFPEKKQVIKFHAKMQRLIHVSPKNYKPYLVQYLLHGRNYSLRRPLMPLHASCLHAIYDFETWNFRTISRGVDLLLFLTKDFCSFLSNAPWSIGPVTVFTANRACPFKYRTHESEIKQLPIYTSRGEKKNEKE